MGRLNKWLILYLLILFCLVGSLLIQVGINCYEEIEIASRNQFKVRTSIGYISNKLREHDKNSLLEIREQDGHQILVLTKEEESLYETWIYCLDHKLYEAYIEKGTCISLDSGFELMTLEDLRFNYDGEKLKVYLETQDREKYELLFQGGST